MKKLVIIVIILFNYGCEDVVDVTLNNAPPKLVIDASINVTSPGEPSDAIVKLSLSKPFFSNATTDVNDAIVEIIDQNNQSTPLILQEYGTYIAPIIIIPDHAYRLEVTYENELYSATETFESVPALEFVEQRNDGGFTGDDIELKAFFTDPAGEDNYYFFEGLSSRGNVYDTFYDEFFDGNSIFGFYLVEDLQAGDVVQFNLYGVDEQFYDFMFTLLQQSTDQSDGPFETQPATVRGNIINQSNLENFPLGYFRISEVSSLEYVVQ